jgi:SAM-dependent methyltransferase
VAIVAQTEDRDGRSMTGMTITADKVIAPSTRCTICANPMRKLWSCIEYTYFACHMCQLVRIAPVPPSEILKDYYAGAYEVDREGYLRNLRRHGRRDLRRLERMIAPGRMLEVGCSWGFFLEAARSRGWQVEGVELSDSTARWANENLGLNTACGTIEDSPFNGEAAFDVVVAWHVIEHVQEPMNFLKIARERLRPGGLLALRTPNIRSVSARINGWVWQWVGAPAHLSLFSPKSLGLATERAGFSVRYVATRRGDAYNPVFELLRGGVLRAGLHQRIKRLLKLQGANGGDASPDGESLNSSRRVRILWRLSKFCDVIFFALYPIEKLFELAGWGPDLFLIAERKD